VKLTDAFCLDQQTSFFAYSVTFFSLLLMVAFFFASVKSPGYLRKEYDFFHLLQNVHPCEMCPDCEVLRTPRSKHCAICNRCVDRFDHHCPWINNCVGINNHNYFLAFITLLLIVLFLLVVSCIVTMANPCQQRMIFNECKLSELCIGCHHAWFKYSMIVFTIIVCIFFGGPAGILLVVHVKNYANFKTTNERYARANRTASAVSEDDVNSLYEDITENGESEALIDGERPRRRRRRGCWGNCGQMCCNKKIMTQRELLQMHMAESALDTSTVHTNE